MDTACPGRRLDRSRREHGDQRRHSGELFFTHPLTVAYYLSEYKVDSAALIAALLHDIAEDTLVSIEQISEQFGPEVSQLVDGVTKLTNLPRVKRRFVKVNPSDFQDGF